MSGNLSDWHPDPQLVPQTDDAKDQFRRLREWADNAYALAETNNDTIAMAIWARAYEKARRLALLFACSANHADPVIEPPTVRNAMPGRLCHEGRTTRGAETFCFCGDRESRSGWSSVPCAEHRGP